MKKFLLYFLSLTSFLIVLLFFLAISFSPILVDNSANQVGNADLINPLLQQTKHAIKNRYDSHELRVSSEQTESLAGFLTRSHQPLVSSVSVKKDELAIFMTYQLSESIFINLSVWVESAEKIKLNGLRVGQLYLPGNLGLRIAEFLVDLYTNSNFATLAIESIDSIDIDDSLITVSVLPLDSLIKEVKNVEISGSLSAREKSERLRKVAHYLILLDSVKSDKQESLTYYIKPVVIEAHARSNNNPVLAIEENRAAILALAIFTGDRRFSSVVGNMSEQLSVIPLAKVKPVLHGRTDLSAHFIFSAAIKLLSEQDFSFAVGEFKELMDRAPDGSGYSFVDLAADMAGVRFASLAFEPNTALNFQKTLTTLNDESVFMPAIDGLTEGLSKQAFTDQYGSVDSELYRQKIATIQSRIDTLPIN